LDHIARNHHFAKASIAVAVRSFDFILVEEVHQGSLSTFVISILQLTRPRCLLLNYHQVYSLVCIETFAASFKTHYYSNKASYNDLSCYDYCRCFSALLFTGQSNLADSKPS
jgi:hypothetical protein